MKHVGKRKVLISAMAMLLVLALTGTALAGSYPSGAFILQDVQERPKETSTPEPTATPEATEAPAETLVPEETEVPAETLVPEQTADPNTTSAPETTEDPDVEIGLEETVEPEVIIIPATTVAPETTVTPETTAEPEATVTPETTAEPEASVEPEAAPVNTITYQRDEAGNLVLDENGSPIAVVPEGMQAPAAYQRDENGALVLDENGNPIPAEAPEATVEPEATPVNTITYERDEAGNLILDENGNPIAIVPEGMEPPKDYVRDETGALVLDPLGNPIPLNTVPQGGKKLSEIVDEQYPNRSIDIYGMFEGDYLNIGDTVTLVSVLNGYEGLVYQYQWQTASAGGDWGDIAGATSSAYSFKLTEENAANQWRIMVTITDVESH